VLGGLDNIYGAIIGGLFLAYTQRILPVTVAKIFGPWIAGYQTLIPIIVIVTILFVEPKGIFVIFSRAIRWYQNKYWNPNQKP
jgi:branched-subunit amino acid ABC-type transport system permease component